ncbi:MAG: peptidoglycan editing factor PgeF [Prevotella salivae]|uniref:peptidoglycan editing factor PgeF n=1 Tax=Segatella salivae TaxID=228604 RepID=UPI001CAF9F19|nr:peptidoglycan editing factor PgeF [Segatella salivae]MBF1523138.1 peptidoglycan editing factor PgeF [Segatella salivae]
MIVPELYEYHLAKDVRAFSSMRRGGVSTGSFCAFNINEFCGDNFDNVVENRRLLATELGITPDNIVMVHQVHDTRCLLIDEAWFQCSAEMRRQATEGYDAILTKLPNVCIGVSTADCIPVLLYDPEHRAIAAVHAGWRGTVQRITEKTVQRMQEVFGSCSDKLRAVIGPGISLDAFEVGDEVYARFSEEGFDMSAISRHDEKWHIDLSACNRLQLLHVGLQSDHILMSNVCTFTHVNDFFSARRLGINSGRIFSGIMLKE